MIEARSASITSPGYREYLKMLLDGY